MAYVWECALNQLPSRKHYGAIVFSSQTGRMTELGIGGREGRHIDKDAKCTADDRVRIEQNMAVLSSTAR